MRWIKNEYHLFYGLDELYRKCGVCYRQDAAKWQTRQVNILIDRKNNCKILFFGVFMLGWV